MDQSKIREWHLPVCHWVWLLLRSIQTTIITWQLAKVVLTRLGCCVRLFWVTLLTRLLTSQIPRMVYLKFIKVHQLPHNSFSKPLRPFRLSSSWTINLNSDLLSRLKPQILQVQMHQTKILIRRLSQYIIKYPRNNSPTNRYPHQICPSPWIQGPDSYPSQYNCHLQPPLPWIHSHSPYFN